MADDFVLRLDQNSYTRLMANLVLLREGVTHVDMDHLVHDVAQPVLEEAMRRCPVETGALRASGRLVREGPQKVNIVFGNDSVDYAVPVHEILHAYHPVGQAKYLESAINDQAAHTGSRFVTRIGTWLSNLAGRFRL